MALELERYFEAFDTDQMPEIYCTNDLDGVHIKAPPPIKTLIQLLKGNLVLPAPNSPLGEFKVPTTIKERFLSNLSILSHRVRAINPEGLETLVSLRNIAQSYDRKIHFAALSGRTQDKHGLTLDILEKFGYNDYFEASYLNPGRSTSRWKEIKVSHLTAEGYSVVHFEDDIKAALCVARVSNVWVYLMRNISNHPAFLRRAGIILPENVVHVSSFYEAVKDFSGKVHAGLI